MVVFACAEQYIFVLIYFMHSSSHAFIPNTYIAPFPLNPGNNSYHFFKTTELDWYVAISILTNIGKLQWCQTKFTTLTLSHLFLPS